MERAGRRVGGLTGSIVMRRDLQGSEEDEGGGRSPGAGAGLGMSGTRGVVSCYTLARQTCGTCALASCLLGR